MNSNTRPPTRNLLPLFAALLATAITGVCAAADAQAPATSAAVAPTQQVDTLQEVWVRGKHLTQVIEDAEDEFFKIYNKKNKNSQYDIFCGTTTLTSSMIMYRKCVPGFIVYNSYNALTNTVQLSGFSYGAQCGSMTTLFDTNGERYFMGGCASGSYSYAPSLGYGAVPTNLLLMARGPDYVKNVNNVVSSDPALVQKANRLIELYNELEATQKHYVSIKGTDQERRRLSGGPVRPYTSPRL